MKKHLNPPTNVEVFNELSGTWNAAKGSIIVGTIIGIITEYAITHHLINSHLTQIFKDLPAVIPMFLAALFVLFLAKERTRYARQVSKMAISEQARQLGFAANLVVIIVFISVFAASIGLSTIGSSAIISSTITSPEIANTAEIDTAQTRQVAAINLQFAKDSASTAANYKAQIIATKKQYNSEIIPLERRKDKRLRGTIDSIYRERNKATAEIEATAAAALIELGKSKIAEKKAISGQSEANRALITLQNTTAANNFTNIAAKSEKYVPLIIIAALLMIGLGCFIDERFKQRAGIKEIILPNEYDLLPTIGSEFSEAFKSVGQGFARFIAIRIKGFAANAASVTDDSTAELIRINLSKYKERVIDAGGNNVANVALTIAPQKRRIGNNAPEKNTVDTVYTAELQQQITEMFNTYKIARRDFKAYKAKEKAGKGTTKTNEAGMTKAANTMQAAQKQLNELGYKIDESRLKLSLIKM